MNINEFKYKYSEVVSEFLEENPGKRAFWGKTCTKRLLDFLQQKNIKIIYKFTKGKPPNHVLEFFLNFLKEHSYFSKKLLIETYLQKINSFGDKFSCEREFKVLIRRYLIYNVIEKYSIANYKVNKDKLSELSNGKRNSSRL